MSATRKCIVESQYLGGTPAKLYPGATADTTVTASGKRTATIVKCTVTNTHTTAIDSAFLWLVPLGGSNDNSNILVIRTLDPVETYDCPEVVGHTLNAGDELWGIAGTASRVNIRVTAVLED